MHLSKLSVVFLKKKKLPVFEAKIFVWAEVCQNRNPMQLQSKLPLETYNVISMGAYFMHSQLEA